jgi:hypothetical protein
VDKLVVKASNAAPQSLPDLRRRDVLVGSLQPLEEELTGVADVPNVKRARALRTRNRSQPGFISLRPCPLEGERRG